MAIISIDTWEYRAGRAHRAWRKGLPVHDAETITTPHCWNALDTFQTDVVYRRGKGSYRCRVTMPPTFSPGSWHLVSGGFYGRVILWIDEKKVASLDASYLGLDINITSYMKPSHVHLIVLELDSSHSRTHLPGIREPDFVLHGGLGANVHMEHRPPTFIDALGFSCVTSALDASSATADFSWVLHNSTTSPITASWSFTIRNPAGQIVFTATDTTTLPPGQNPLSLRVRLSEPNLWHVNHPHLYQTELTLTCETITHTRTFHAGLRTTEFREDGRFYLNGEPLLLRGINRHENMPGFGNALPLAVHKADAARIRELGLNFVRLSHYPQHHAFLDACDQLGLLVYAEICTWKSVKGGRWLTHAEDQMRRMILRDQRHPSVILWGMGNEARHRQAYLRLTQCIRSLDPSRPTIYAENHLYRALRKKTADIPDVYGCNYELDVLDKIRTHTKDGCVLLSEMSNCPRERGDVEGELEQVQVLEADLDRLETFPWVAGFCVWCLNDYATMRKRRHLRFSGVQDAWREPKFAAHYLRARFSDQPFGTTYAEWSLSHPSSERRFFIFTNAREITIKIGTDIQRVLIKKPFQLTAMPFQHAPLEIAYHHTQHISHQTIHPWGAPESYRWEQHSEACIRFIAIDNHGNPVLNYNDLTVLFIANNLAPWNKKNLYLLRSGTTCAWFSPSAKSNLKPCLPDSAQPV